MSSEAEKKKLDLKQESTRDTFKRREREREKAGGQSSGAEKERMSMRKEV